MFQWGAGEGRKKKIKAKTKPNKKQKLVLDLGTYGLNPSATT